MNPQPVETRTEHAVDGLFNGLIGLAVLFFFLIPFIFLFRWIYRKIDGRWGQVPAILVTLALVIGSWTAAYVWSEAEDAKAFAPIEYTEQPAASAPSSDECDELGRVYGMAPQGEETRLAQQAWLDCLRSTTD